MAIGMIRGQPVAEPEQVLDAEIGGEPRLDLLASHARIAVRVEQTLLRGHGEAGSVDVDRAAFEDPVVPRGIEAEALRQPRTERVVSFEPKFSAPAVEAEA